MYIVLEKYQDIANKYNIRVKINDDRSIFLKFQVDPTQEEIDVATENFLNSEE